MCAGLGVLAVVGLLASPSPAAESSPYAKAMAAYQDRRLDEALQQAQEAVRQEPGHVDARALLGELYYLRQELSQAQEQWEQALKLAPSRADIRQRLDRLQREAPLERDLKHSDTYPFVVRFAEGQVPVELGALRQLLREAYRLVGQQFSYFPDHPISVLLYPGAGFEQVKGVSHQIGGLYDGKIRLPLRSGDQAGRELERVFRHEYTHAIVHDLAKGNCPIWLNEGIATLQEARVSTPNLSEFRAAVAAGRPIPWAQLWREQYENGSLSLRYQEAYTIAQYLVKRGGWSQLVGLLQRLGWGVPINDALKAEYHEEPAVLEHDWLLWARREG